MELLNRHFALVDFTGGQGHEQDVMLNAVAAIQRVIRLMTVSPQIGGCFGVFLGIHERRNLVRHLNDAVSDIKIGIVFPQINFDHFIFLRFDFWGLGKSKQRMEGNDSGLDVPLHGKKGPLGCNPKTVISSYKFFTLKFVFHGIKLPPKLSEFCFFTLATLGVKIIVSGALDIIAFRGGVSG